jgi:hypothetical protein
MPVDDNTSDEHFIFNERNNLFNNIISNSATTQMRGSWLQFYGDSANFKQK